MSDERKILKEKNKTERVIVDKRPILGEIAAHKSEEQEIQ